MKLLDSLKIDPDMAKVLPPTTAQEDKAHKKTIQKEGVVYPLVADEQGVLIDGIRTYKVCRELNVRDLWVVTLYGLTEEERRHKRLALNVNRRHLTRKQKRTLIRQELLNKPSWSGRALARLLGVDNKTVEAVRQELLSNEEIPQCSIEASDGRVFKASGVISSLHGVRAVQKELADPSGHAATGRILLPKKYAKLSTAKRRASIAKMGSTLPTEQDYRLHCCRFQDLLKVEPDLEGQATLILTDPPWTDAFCPEYDDLGEMAQKILKPDGIMIVYSGVMHLPVVLSVLDEYLPYVWTLGLPSQNCPQWDKGGLKIGSLSVYPKWRPIVIFVNGIEPTLKAVSLQDWWEGSKAEKQFHDWQQSLPETKALIEKFTEQGDLVVDLCGGSFTTAHAAKELGRRFVGCDIDQECVDAGKFRISQVSPQSSLSA
jgi:ParB-like chromosome segregation protein Spo0J